MTLDPNASNNSPSEKRAVLSAQPKYDDYLNGEPTSYFHITVPYSTSTQSYSVSFDFPYATVDDHAEFADLSSDLQIQLPLKSGTVALLDDIPTVDSTLSVSGAAADAKTVGDKFTEYMNISNRVVVPYNITVAGVSAVTTTDSDGNTSTNFPVTPSAIGIKSLSLTSNGTATSYDGSSDVSVNLDNAYYRKSEFGDASLSPKFQSVELITPNAGTHNSLFRGKYLGSSLTSAQSAAIQAGTFDDLYVGDYWTINSVNWRIAALDYYYNTGDTACTTHHAVIVPDENLYFAQMNTSNTTEGAYVGSAMYKTNLATALTTIQNAFGSAHVLKIRNHFQNAVTNGHPSGGTWYDAQCWLMTEQNVYGGKCFGSMSNGSATYNNYVTDNAQYPLFHLRHDLVGNRQGFWLRDTASSSAFCLVRGRGNSGYDSASNSGGVRPAFCLI